MKIVIEIDDATYKYAKDYAKATILCLSSTRKVMAAICNGEVISENTESEGKHENNSIT